MEILKHPRVGLGIIIVNKEGKILIGKRIGGHAPRYSILVGKLELGETFEQGAIREIKEEGHLHAFPSAYFFSVISASSTIFIHVSTNRSGTFSKCTSDFAY